MVEEDMYKKSSLILILGILLFFPIISAFNYGETSTTSNDININILNGSIVNHNNLTGLQGGGGGEYYHIIQAWYNELSTDILNWITQAEGDARYVQIGEENTYNSTYNSLVSQNASLWLQALDTYNATYDLWAYNQTIIYTSLSNFTDDLNYLSTYNSTYDSLVSQNASLWLQALDTYNATYLSTYNATYNLWSYNQTEGGDGRFILKTGDNMSGALNVDAGGLYDISGGTDTNDMLVLTPNSVDGKPKISLYGNGDGISINANEGENIIFVDDDTGFATWNRGGSSLSTNVTVNAGYYYFGDGSKLTGITSEGIFNQTYADKNSSYWTKSGSDIYYNDGKVGIGTTTPTHELTIEGETNGLAMGRIVDNTNSPFSIFRKSRGNKTDMKEVEENDQIGKILFRYYNGTNWDNTLADFVVYADSDIINGYAGGRISLRTNENTDTSPTERLTIINDGKIGIGTATPQTNLHIENAGHTTLRVASSSSANDAILQLVDGTKPTEEGLVIWHDSSTGDEYFDNLFDNVAGDFHFRNRVEGTPVNSMSITGSGKVGIGTTTPSYPFTVIGNTSGISGWFDGNVSASGFITRTSVFDKTKGSALNLIKDSDDLKTLGKIDHKKFYGYTTWETNIPDTSKPVLIKEGNKTIITYPFEKKVTETGVDLGKEIDVLRQAVYELKNQNSMLMTELCTVSKGGYSWC